MKNIKITSVIATLLVVATFAAVQIFPEITGLGGVVGAMALTGFTKSCGLQSGGGKRIYLVEVADLTSFTLAAGIYTTATMESGKVFKEYQFEQDSFEIKEDVSFENNCMKVSHGIEFYLNKMSATTRTAVEEIALASACGLISIVEDNNGTKWVLGYSENHLKLRPLMLKTGKGTSGKKFTDANGYTLSLESEDNTMMRTFSGTVPTT